MHESSGHENIMEYRLQDAFVLYGVQRQKPTEPFSNIEPQLLKFINEGSINNLQPWGRSQGRMKEVHGQQALDLTTLG